MLDVPEGALAGRHAPCFSVIVAFSEYLMAIVGMHALIYSKKDEATRAFFRDVLGFPFVDAGRG